MPDTRPLTQVADELAAFPSALMGDKTLRLRTYILSVLRAHAGEPDEMANAGRELAEAADYLIDALCGYPLDVRETEAERLKRAREEDRPL